MNFILCPPTIDIAKCASKFLGIMTKTRNEMDLGLHPQNLNLYINHVANVIYTVFTTPCYLYVHITLVWSTNSDLEAGIWFGSVAPSPIITLPHYLMVLCLGCLDKVLVLKFVLKPTHPPRYRVQDGSWPNHKKTAQGFFFSNVNVNVQLIIS